MRASQKTAILDAALAVVSAQEGADITLDAVARRAGITKPGLMYHFPTREALLLAIVEHAATRVEAAMHEALSEDGLTFEAATPAQRVRAYARVAASGHTSRAEYAVFTEAAYRPALTAPWTECMAAWFDLPTALPESQRARLTLARLAADGLWAAEATGVFPPDPADRTAVLALIDQLTDDHNRSTRQGGVAQ
ncbi:TetR/AcrR family transcriptional regulator [Actinopolymorpha alba]|uniref:TetR/AcrR family transcriptional regulator n=1 Tax=Actinopolymorpha alba TaxID=533267 RepID=UPI000360C02A|nr:TetR family transcriptional regulator [Actinopolymorpha alba]